MPTEQDYLQTLEKIQSDCGGFIAASLVDLESGMTLASKTARSDFDLAAASAYNSELVKQKLKIMQTLGLSGSIEDMLISLSGQIHLIKMIGDRSFLYLAVDRNQSNLAIVRSVVQRHAGSLS